MLRSLAIATLMLTATAAGAAPAQKPDEHEKSADDAEKVICKRFKETGSLVSSRRVCKSKRDWERERDALRTNNGINSCANQVGAGTC
jgi:ribosomal protein S1